MDLEPRPGSLPRPRGARRCEGPIRDYRRMLGLISVSGLLWGGSFGISEHVGVRLIVLLGFKVFLGGFFPPARQADGTSVG